VNEISVATNDPKWTHLRAFESIVVSVARNILLYVLVIPLAGCIAPLPVESVADPWIRGTIVNNSVAAASVEVWLDHEDDDACESPGMWTLTDADGKFSFEGKTRSWTWIGWANNHYVSGCIYTPDGPKSFGTIAVNDPRTIEIYCDVAKHPREMCSFSCDTDGFGERC
jgi:hypothetical protein